MYSIPQPDGSILTTPVYIGTAAEVRQAKTCQHEFAPLQEPPQWHERPDTLVDGSKIIYRMSVEKCSKCCARRMRYFQKPPEAP